MWAGNALKNNLDDLEDLADFLHNSDSEKINYKGYLDTFDKKIQEGNGVTRALFKTYRATFTKIIFLVFFFKIFDVMIIYMMYELTGYLKKQSDLKEEIHLGTVSIIFICIVLSDFYKTVISSKSSYTSNALGLNIKGLTMTKVYDKVVRISLKSNKNFSEGEIIDYIQTDCSNFKLIGVAVAFVTEAFINIAFLGVWGYLLFGYRMFVLLVVFAFL